MAKIRMTNDFHNTFIDLYVKGDTLTRYQMHRVREELCGMSDCACGGVRGSQEFEYDHEWILDGEGSQYPTIRIINGVSQKKATL
jgi:hypothetical protein